MARGKQLLELVAAVREESGRASSIAVGVDDLPGLKAKIKRTQELLYDAFDWPFLREIFPLKPLQAGEQYYDFPTGLNLERVERVEVWYANLPRPLTRGISTREYAIYNSTNGVTQEPAMRGRALDRGQRAVRDLADPVVELSVGAVHGHPQPSSAHRG